MTEDRMNGEDFAEAAYDARRRADSPFADLEARLSRANARLQVLRTWIHAVDWELLCKALPEARCWFDEDGVPK